MNVLSLFDGISCGQIALQKAGIKVDNYYASEIDKNAIKVTQHNWPNTIQLGSVVDVKAENLPRIDLICAGSPCFVAGTRVLTSRGYKNIENIQVGDEVLSHKGSWKDVLKTGGKSNSPTISLFVKGSLPIQTTKEHPFFVRVRSTIWENSTRRYKTSFASPTWKEVKSVKRGDLIGFPRMKNQYNELYELSNDELFVLGRYIADGHTRKNYRISEGRPNDRNWQLILSIGKGKEFVTSCNHSFYPHEKNVNRMVFSNKKLVELAENYCGCGAENKYISPQLLSLPRDKLSIVLDGLISGDGSSRKNEFRLTTVSYNLLLSMQMAVIKCYGTSGCLIKTIRPKTTIIEGRTVNQKDTYSISFRKVNSLDLLDENYVWSYVKGINNDAPKQDVFNLEVRDDNSYTIQNILVHNCQGFSSAGKQLNFEDPRSKLFFEFVRLLKECRPKYFLLENVRMKKEYQDIISNHLGVQPILINSSKLSAQNRERFYWTNIPNVLQPEDKGIILKDIIEEDYDGIWVWPRGVNKGGVKSYRGKSPSVTTSSWQHNFLIYNGSKSKRGLKVEGFINSNSQGNRVYSIDGKSSCLNATSGATSGGTSGNGNSLVLVRDMVRKFTPQEVERLQTVPVNYTSCISDNQRFRYLGNGWTVDVIAHILKNIPQA